MESPEPEFEFITHPELMNAIPEPEPASRHLPDWYKNVPMEMDGGSERSTVHRSTVRACMPFLDALRAGWIFKAPVDIAIHVDGADIDYKSGLNREPMGQFDAAQVGDMFPKDGHILNLYNYWRVKAPEGWSMLFTHPFNRFEETRFEALTGVVDVDNHDDRIDHPIIWTDLDFEGIIEQGTPIAQAIPIHRDWLSMDANCRAATDEEELENKQFRNAIKANQRHYKEEVWDPIDGASVTTEEESESGWQKEE